MTQDEIEAIIDKALHAVAAITGEDIGFVLLMTTKPDAEGKCLVASGGSIPPKESIRLMEQSAKTATLAFAKMSSPTH